MNTKHSHLRLVGPQESDELTSTDAAPTPERSSDSRPPSRSNAPSRSNPTSRGNPTSNKDNSYQAKRNRAKRNRAKTGEAGSAQANDEPPNNNPDDNESVDNEPADNEPNDKERKETREKKLTQSEQLLRYVDDEDVDLFTSPTKGAFVTFPLDNRRETAPLKNSHFGDWLKYQFYEDEGRPPSAQAFSDTMGILRARANFEGETRTVHVRVAGAEDNIYIDLCNSEGGVVMINPRYWGVKKEPPVLFHRTSGMAPLPTPLAHEPLAPLRNHFRLDAKNLALLCGFLVQCLRPKGPYPILVLTGEQGAGKSTAARMIRSLVDPSTVPLRTAPNSEKDLALAATNNWLLTYDNLDAISPSMSNAFCRLSTGGGFETRRLFSSRQQEIFSAQRPLVLNGITDLLARSDLRDRAVVIELEPIPDRERRPEREVWTAFEEDRPAIFGALCEAVHTALKRIDDVKLERPPRMADFAEWAVAAEPVFPLPEGRFMQAYRTNREDGAAALAASDPVAAAILELLDEESSWTGTTSDLLRALQPHLPDPARPPRDFPRSYQAMGGHLRRIAPLLRAAGIEKIDDSRARSRSFTLKRSGPTSNSP